MIPINKRKIGVCILLSIITSGIYQIYWEYLLVKNIRAMQKDETSCTGEMLCLVFVPFYSLYWWFTRGKIVKDKFAEHGCSARGNEITYLILGIFGLNIVSMAIMQNDFNSLESESIRSLSSSFPYSQKVAPYVFIAPFVVIFLVFFLYPLISTVVMSFQRVVPGQTEFIGLENYSKMMNKTFFTALKNSAIYTVCTCAILIPVPMFLAVILNSKKMVAKGFFRSALFVPALVCVVVAGITFRLIFGERPSALMNTILMHLGMSPIKWLAGPIGWTTMFAMVLLCCWRWMGVNTMYYLSALQSISDDLYESADIDGANAWQKFWHITVPLLKPTTIYVLTISIYGGLAMFAEAKMLFPGTETGNKALTIVGYLYRVGIRKANYGLGSAIGIVLLVLTMLVNLLQLTLTGFFKKEE